MLGLLKLLKCYVCGRRSFHVVYIHRTTLLLPDHKYWGGSIQFVLLLISRHIECIGYTLCCNPTHWHTLRTLFTYIFVDAINARTRGTHTQYSKKLASLLGYWGEKNKI